MTSEPPIEQTIENQSSFDDIKEVVGVPLLNDAFHTYLHEEDEEDKRHEPVVGEYHASAGAKCIRKRFYEDTKVKELFPFDRGIGERGDRIEDFALDVLMEFFHEQHSDLGVTVHQDLPISVEFGDWKITGQSDPYLEYDGEVLAITEIKSKARQDGINTSDIPDFSHMVQLNTYLSAAGVDTGFIIYIESGTFEYHIVPFEQDENLWEYTKLLHSIYHDYRERDELPPRMPVKPNDCKWCQYRALCERNNDGRDFREE